MTPLSDEELNILEESSQRGHATIFHLPMGSLLLESYKPAVRY
jgi:hypothetical protein